MAEECGHNKLISELSWESRSHDYTTTYPHRPRKRGAGLFKSRAVWKVLHRFHHPISEKVWIVTFLFQVCPASTTAWEHPEFPGTRGLRFCDVLCGVYLHVPGIEVPGGVRGHREQESNDSIHVRIVLTVLAIYIIRCSYDDDDLYRNTIFDGVISSMTDIVHTILRIDHQYNHPVLRAH